MQDVVNLSDQDLDALSRAVGDELKRRMVRQRADAKKQIAELAAKHSIDLGELAGRTASGAKVNYRNPDNDLETWAGKGRKPKWLVDRLAAGAKLEAFEID